MVFLVSAASEVFLTVTNFETDALPVQAPGFNLLRPISLFKLRQSFNVFLFGSLPVIPSCALCLQGLIIKM